MSLVSNPDGSWDLTHEDTGLVYHFNQGRVVTVSDVDGATVSLTYDTGGGLSSVQDTTTGTATTFTKDANGDIVQAQQGAQTFKYTYGGADGTLLATFTDAAGNITRYGYDTSDRLGRITPPDGSYWQISYDSLNRVQTLQHVTDTTTGTGPTTTYAYNQATLS